MGDIKRVEQLVNVDGDIHSVDPDRVKAKLAEINDIQAILRSILKPGEDYGSIKYTKNGKQVETKPFLYKSGAEKIAYALNLRVTVDIIDKVVTDDEVTYTVKCRFLRKDGSPMSEGLGHASSSEYKFWKQVKDQEKSGVPTRVAVRSVANTILKMAEKRAIVDAALHVFALSNIFSQDEDYVETEIKREQREEQHSANGQHQQKQKSQPEAAPVAEDEPEISDIGEDLGDDDFDFFNDEVVNNTIKDYLNEFVRLKLVDEKFVNYIMQKEDVDSKLKLMLWKIKEIKEERKKTGMSAEQLTTLEDAHDEFMFILNNR